MIASMTLGDLASFGTLVAAVVALVALLYAATQVRTSALKNRGLFWLEIEKMFQTHAPIHRKLRPGGKWGNNAGAPATAEEWSALEDYMALFEHCEIMIEWGILDEQTFLDLFSYRLQNIVDNRTVFEAKLGGSERPFWTNFRRLLERTGVELPRD